MSHPKDPTYIVILLNFMLGNTWHHVPLFELLTSLDIGTTCKSNGKCSLWKCEIKKCYAQTIFIKQANWIYHIEMHYYGIALMQMHLVCFSIFSYIFCNIFFIIFAHNNGYTYITSIMQIIVFVLLVSSMHCFDHGYHLIWNCNTNTSSLNRPLSEPKRKYGCRWIGMQMVLLFWHVVRKPRRLVRTLWLLVRKICWLVRKLCVLPRRLSHYCYLFLQ